MKNGPLRALQAVLWFVCASHLAHGVALMFSQTLQKQVALLYAAQVDWTPQFIYILRALGAFMFALGVMGVGAALDPLRYRLVVYGFAVLLLIRVLQRIILQGDIRVAFAVPPTHLIAGSGFFLAFGIALVVLMEFARRSSVAPES